MYNLNGKYILTDSKMLELTIYKNNKDAVSQGLNIKLGKKD